MKRRPVRARKPRVSRPFRERKIKPTPQLPEQGAGDGRTIILAIDQAATSGWAIWTGKCVEFSGVAKKAVDRRSAVATAFTTALERDVPVIAVFEDHGKFRFTRGNMSVPGLLGMGAARGAWEQELEMHSIRDVRKVTPEAWRKAVLGLGTRATREQAKEAAKLYAHALLGHAVGDDEAEAVAMASFAARNFAAKWKRVRKTV